MHGLDQAATETAPQSLGEAWGLWNCAVGQSHDSGEQEVLTKPESLCPHPHTRLRQAGGLWRGGSLLTVQLQKLPCHFDVSWVPSSLR